MPCHFDYQKLEDYPELSREEKMEQVLCEIWQMMDNTVSDPVSAHLEEALTNLEIEHDALILKPPKKQKSEVGDQIKEFLLYSAKSLNG